MKKIITVLGLLGVILTGADAALGEKKSLYKHPTLPVQFEAMPHWQRISRPEGQDIYELADPEGCIHVILWSATSAHSGLFYLGKMAGMKGLDLSLNGVPETRMIDGNKAHVLTASGVEQGISIRTFLAVVPHGRSAGSPRENVFFIIQIWCPESDFERNEEEMIDILNSFEFLNRPSPLNLQTF